MHSIFPFTLNLRSARHFGHRFFRPLLACLISPRCKVRLVGVLAVLVLAVGSVFAPEVGRAQTGSSIGSFTVSAHTAVGIALSAAAEYQVNHDNQWSDYEYAVTIAVLNGVDKIAANTGQTMTTAAYNAIASQVKTALDQSAQNSATFQADDMATRLRYAIDSLAPLAASAPAGSPLPAALGDLEEIKFNQLEAAFDSSRAVPEDYASYSLMDAANQLIANWVHEASDLAQNDPQYGPAVNTILQTWIQLDSTSSYADIQNQYPSVLPILPASNSGGSFTLNTQDLMNQYQSVVSNMQSTIDADLSTIEASNGVSSAASQGAQSDAETVAQSLPKASADPSLSNSANTTQSDPYSTAQGAVTGFSGLVKLWDPQAANDIAVMGGAEIQVAKNVDAIASAIGQGASLATLISPVSGIFGAAVQLFGLFSGGASTSAVTTAQIQALSKEIVSFQTDMNTRFNQVDAALNTMYSTLNADFAMIDYQLGVLNGDAIAIQGGLLDVHSQLNQLEQYIQAYIQADELSGPTGFDSEANNCLNYRAQHNGGDINGSGGPGYNSCESDFYTWAYNTSSSAVWALPVTDYSNGNIFNVFEDSTNAGISGCTSSGCPTPFAVDVNYLAQFPAMNLGLTALSSDTLSNPDE
jgi:hypothetical protein